MTRFLARINRQPADGREINPRGNSRANGRYAKERWFQWLKWGDFLMYGLIGGLAAVLLLVLPDVLGQTAAAAVLTQDGQAVLELSPSDLAGSGAREVTANGYHYRIVWQDGQIRFAAADCPDKICVQTGWISRPNELAACVPGHLILKIESGPDPAATSEVDVIVK